MRRCDVTPYASGHEYTVSQRSSDTEWACVQRYLPLMPSRGRPRSHPLRRILDAVFYVLRTGCPWRYLLANFPPWQTEFYHFHRFRLTGIWHRLYMAFHRAERERVGRHPDPSAAIMDSQSVKTVEESVASAAMMATSSSRAESGASWPTPWACPSPGTSPPPACATPSAPAGS